ncbi:MAG: DNA polymerase III subunit delta' [Deltaproteobacteria bacterium]|nr:DNA polymerase III subunit delta' [Deltaproteobacteria bacterium]
MKLSQIQGQDKVIESLRAAIAAGRLHHAWLFVGPRGVGKRTTAFALAAAVNCDNGPMGGGLFAGAAPGATFAEACGSCPSCIKMASGNHPDLHIVAGDERAEEAGLAGHLLGGGESGDAEGGDDDAKGAGARRTIKVGKLRDLEYHLLRKSTEGRFKIAIIVDADQMNPHAANALLKTLEEPMGDTLIVLTSSAPSRLPATIPSRCRRVRFSALPEPLVARVLADAHGMTADRASLLAHVSDGSIGRALAIEKGEMTDWVIEAVARVAGVPGQDATDALELAEELGKGKDRADTVRRLLVLFDLLGVYYRDTAVGAWADGWSRVMAGAAAGDVLRNFEYLDEARRALDLHVGPQVTLESLFMKMRAAARTA